MREILLLKDGVKTLSVRKQSSNLDHLWQRLVLFNFIQCRGAKGKNASLAGEDWARSLSKAKLTDSTVLDTNYLWYQVKLNYTVGKSSSSSNQFSATRLIYEAKTALNFLINHLAVYAACLLLISVKIPWPIHHRH